MYYHSDYYVYFNPNGGVWDTDDDYNGTTETIKKSNLADRNYFTDLGVGNNSVKKEGFFMKGWRVGSPDSEKIYYIYIDSYDMFQEFYVNWLVESPSSSEYNDVPIESEDTLPEEPEDTPQDDVIAYTRDIYKITYNTNGGEFIDGTSNRISYIPSNLQIGNPKTNPIKDGYKFKEWQLNGEKFDFSQKPSADITLTAVYEELTEEDKLYYCENDNHVLDYSTKICYNVLKADNNTYYNYTLYSYKEGATFCYAASTSTPGGIHFRKDIVMDNYLNITGKTGEPYTGYDEQESWVSDDTCKIATECTETDQSVDYPACQIKWSTIIYSSTAAITKENEFNEEEESPIVPPDEDNENQEENDKTDADLTDKDAEDLKTGDALIILAWIAGLGALGYTVYYFIKRKNTV
ncbi:MAG: InlB B-repeat-containing protein [Bacilli bacterium]|nr:InlB B-repeat-containing protein [Bacilli bacterium]